MKDCRVIFIEIDRMTLRSPKVNEGSVIRVEFQVPNEYPTGGPIYLAMFRERISAHLTWT